MSNNSINSPTFTELELSGIAIVLYLLISPIHGISKITEPILKMFNIKSATSLLFFTGFLFGIIYYFSIELVLHPMYKKLRAVGFKVGAQGQHREAQDNIEAQIEIATRQAHNSLYPPKTLKSNSNSNTIFTPPKNINQK